MQTCVILENAFFFLSDTPQSHLTQECICALILLDMPRSNDFSGAWSCRPFCLLSQQALKMMKTKMCNKGGESACLAAGQCVGPSDATCSVSACMVVRPQKKAQVVLGHRFSPPMKRGQMMWGVLWYLLSGQEDLSVFCKKNCCRARPGPSI